MLRSLLRLLEAQARISDELDECSVADLERVCQAHVLVGTLGGAKVNGSSHTHQGTIDGEESLHQLLVHLVSIERNIFLQNWCLTL